MEIHIITRFVFRQENEVLVPWRTEIIKEDKEEFFRRTDALHLLEPPREREKNNSYNGKKKSFSFSFIERSLHALYLPNTATYSLLQLYVGGPNRSCEQREFQIFLSKQNLSIF